jgi:hypothetical protein
MKDEREIEILLERFLPRPTPGGLREKVIQAAHRESEARRILTPAWRWALASSFVLMAVIMVADWRVSAREENRLSALTIVPGAGAISPEKAADEKSAEVLAYLPDLDPASVQAVRQSFLKDRRAADRFRRSAARPTEGINEY